MSRTPEEIYEDITTTTSFDDTQRVHDLWDELAKVVTRDFTAPPWARLAVVLLRDQFARELKAART